jgi:hypothetical protein
LAEYVWTQTPAKGSEDREHYLGVCRALASTGATVHFLSDKRITLSFQRPRKVYREYIDDVARIHVRNEGLEEEDDSWLLNRCKPRESVALPIELIEHPGQAGHFSGPPLVC